MASNNPTSVLAEDALETLGLSFVEELFIEPSKKIADILTYMKKSGNFNVCARLKELTTLKDLDDGTPFFLGGGCYDHFIPMSIENTVKDGDLYTMYKANKLTACASILQMFVDYRDALALLTDASTVNASVYCGCGVLARACELATEITGRSVILASGALNPDQLTLLRAYAEGGAFELRVIPEREGATDLDALVREIKEVGENAAAFVIQYPNFFGQLERLTQTVGIVKSVGALTVAYVDPIALSVLKSPIDWGADILAGDGAPHGSPIGFESCRLGFIALSERTVRLLPNCRLCKIYDRDGNPGVGLKLQSLSTSRPVAERVAFSRSRDVVDATLALTYYARMEIAGLRRVANESHELAKYACETLATAGFQRIHNSPFLYEFAVKVDGPREMNAYLRKWGVVGGYELPDGLLFAFTEKRSIEEIEELVYFMKTYLLDRGRI